MTIIWTELSKFNITDDGIALLRVAPARVSEVCVEPFLLRLIQY
jgi:hypothetical protein